MSQKYAYQESRFKRHLKSECLLSGTFAGAVAWFAVSAKLRRGRTKPVAGQVLRFQKAGASAPLPAELFPDIF